MSLFLYETSNLFKYSIIILLVLLLGISDDIYKISYIKDLIQIFICSLIFGNGIIIKDLGTLMDDNSVFYLGYFAFLISILSVVGLTSALK